MSGTGHLFLRTIHPFIKPTLTSPSSFCITTSGITVKLLPPRLQSWHVVLRASHLRIFKVQPKETPQWWQNFSTKISKHLPADTKISGLLQRRNPINLSRSFKEHAKPAKMYEMMNRLQKGWGKTHTKGRLWIFIGLMFIFGYLQTWWHRHKIKLPLNGRETVHIYSMEEALEQSRQVVEMMLYHLSVSTERDDQGKPTDRQTIRCTEIIKSLCDANPELTAHLLPGVAFTPQLIAYNSQLGHQVICTTITGDIFMAEDIIKQLNDDQLAFALAHELVHIVQRHYMEWKGAQAFIFHYFNEFFKPIKENMVDFDLVFFMKKFKDYMILTDPYLIEKEADEFGFKFACKACFNFRQFADGLELLDSLLPEDKRSAVTSVYDWSLPENFKDLPWEDQIVSAMLHTGLTVETRHLPLTERCANIRSQDWVDSAMLWRKEANCDPEPPLETLLTSQKSQHTTQHPTQHPTQQSQHTSQQPQHLAQQTQQASHQSQQTTQQSQHTSQQSQHTSQQSQHTS